MILRVWDHNWYPTLASNAIYCSLKCESDKAMASLLLEPLVTCLCHGVQHGGLGVCAHRSYYTSTWFSFIFVPCNICFVSTRPWILGVHNRLQTNRCTYLRHLDSFLGAWEKVMRSVLAYAHTNVISCPLVSCFTVDLKRKSSGLWDVNFSQTIYHWGLQFLISIRMYNSKKSSALSLFNRIHLCVRDKKCWISSYALSNNSNIGIDFDRCKWSHD